MNMGVDEARENELLGMILNRVVAKRRRQSREGPGPQDAAIIARDHRTPLVVNHIDRPRPEAYRLAADDESHGATLSSMRNRKMRQI